MRKALLLSAAVLAGVPAMAVTEVSGVSVPDKITLQDADMIMNGAGVRSKFFMDLYVGSLFTTEATSDASDIVDSGQPSAIRLNITSGMITSEKMAEAMREGFDLATDGDISAIAPQIEAFISTFAEPIKEGDQFTLLSVPGEGIVSYKNGEVLSTTHGEAFRKAVLSVWLGPDPIDKKLKKKMLTL